VSRRRAPTDTDRILGGVRHEFDAAGGRIPKARFGEHNLGALASITKFWCISP
jgi:hypothetical protein